MEWLEAAKQLPLGHKRRMRHDCSESRDLIVSHNEGGYSAYCFRCGNVGFEGHGYQSLAEIARLSNLNTQAQRAQTNELPSDYDLHIPEGSLSWLLKAGISPSRAANCGIGWSESLHRIILPVYSESGRLVYWQGRAVDKGQDPKYTNPAVPKATVLYRCDPPNERSGKSRVVVTEDILSAVRVGLHVPTRSIMGTKTSDEQAAQLSEFEEVIYWLDPDEAGRRGAHAGIRKLGLVTSARTIETAVDPKNLSDRAIRDALGLPPNQRYTYHDDTNIQTLIPASEARRHNNDQCAW